MKYILLALFLTCLSYGQGVRQNGIGNNISVSKITTSSITLVGSGSECLSADNGLVGIDCNQGFVGIGDSNPDAPLEILSNSSPTGYLLAVSSQNDVLGGILALTGNGFFGINDPDPLSLLDVESNQSPSGFVFTVSSQNAVTGNIISVVGSGAISFGVNSPLTVSSATFVGVSISSSTRGGAGASVTATCPTNLYAISGGCDCNTIVSATSIINTPSAVVPGSVSKGWTCQVAGGTGGQCAAYAICSRLQ